MHFTKTTLGRFALAALVGQLAAPSAASLGASPSADPPTSADFVGHWQGTITVGETRLRIVFHIRESGEGGLEATLDSPDQGTTGIPVATATAEGDSLRLEIRAASAVYVGRLADDGRTIEGEWRQGGRAFPLEVERVDEFTEMRRPQEPEPPHPYAEEEVRIAVPGADVELAGTLTLPEHDRPAPAVVLVSGSGPQNRDGTIAGHRPFLVLADHLTRRGVAVLRTDDRGTGGSTGSTFEASLDDRARDVLAAVRLLAEHPGIDGDRIGAVGHSEGGWVVSVAAARAPAEIAYAVLMAGPGQSPRDLLVSQQRALLEAGGVSEVEIAARQALQRGAIDIVRGTEDTVAARSRLERWREELLTELPGNQRRALEAYFGGQTEADREGILRTANTAWFRDLLAFDAEPLLREMDQPVLALFGAKDLQVPVGDNAPLQERLLDADGRPDREVRVLPGLNHLFQPAESGLPAEYATIDTTLAPVALRAVGEWIERWTGRAGPEATPSGDAR